MSVLRSNAVTGQSIKLSLVLNENGAPLNILEVVRVDLFDASDMSVVRSFTGADIIQEDVGNYYVLTNAFASPITLIDRWTYRVALGVAPSSIQFTTAVISPSIDDRLSGMAISITHLRDNYLFGLDLTDDNGDPFPDSMFIESIRYATSFIEKKLDILLTPQDVTETHDYVLEEYRQFGWFQVDKRPLNSITSVSAVYPFSSTNGRKTIIEFPESMISVPIKESGVVQLVPNQGSIAQFMLGRGADYLPLIRNGYASNYPALFEIKYNAGFAEVPPDIKHCVSLYASLNILDVAGDLIVGAGIASKSISIGGLSQSINTTSSATNAGYGARILSYQKQVKVLLPTLERYYHGLRMAVV